MKKQKKKKKTGPKEERLVIEGNWKEAVRRSLRKRNRVADGLPSSEILRSNSLVLDWLAIRATAFIIEKMEVLVEPIDYQEDHNRKEPCC